MSFIAHLNGTPSRKTRLLTVLDVGSSKIVCIIARLRPLGQTEYLHGRTHSMEVLGFGIQRSQGIKAGIIVDMSKAETAIRLAVDSAERMAGLIVDSVIVNFSAGKLKSTQVHSKIKINGDKVDMRDVRRVLSECSRSAFDLDRYIVHSLPGNFNLDGETGISDPRDMMGHELGAEMHVVTAESAPLRNLEHCINRAHLSVETVVATPYASGLSVLVGDEPRLGTACVDIGAGTTTISIFSEGRFVYTDMMPIGANHITLDIARGFTIPLDEAERIKVMHGSALSVSADDRHMISMPSMGDDNGQDSGLAGQYPRALLSRIIRARVEEILEMTRDKLTRSGFGSLIGKRIILTGGGSQLPGIAEVGRHILKSHLRIGRPLGISGLPDMARGAAFSSAVGLLIYPQISGLEEYKVHGSSANVNSNSGHFSRVGHWLRGGLRKGS
ncbi:cell division protein FtsA [Bartonella sp. HY329]|uniref:cell division protein FtsA n=1 Tax=unclassified Bartonella TaxID=2645622 RepID=UPI0021CA7774|nr:MULTISPECIES: cell division protein FtsA [unclassified Bartonella]UXM94543.1 cell division protein FtsA [Bartonella sp. HY329]UXN08867.1 cell division protein FtsA [Bartonella sp. HY328]